MPETTSKTRQHALLAVLVFLIGSIYFLDTTIELGVAGGVPYVLAICVAYQGSRRYVWWTTAVCCALTIVGFFQSPAGGELWKVLANRGLAIFAITTVALFADVAKRAQLSVKRNEDDLARRIQERTAQLQSANKRLRISNEELEQFAYIASHDLQEPLRSVTTFCQLLEKEFPDELPGDGRAYLDFILDGTSRMRTLIQDLLVFSRANEPLGPIKELQTTAIVNEAIANVQSNIESCEAEITVDPLPVIRGEHRRLVQLFQNLIGNAIKYCDEAPRVHISAIERPNELQFSVTDNGIGIAEDYHQTVFKVFKRLHTRDEYSGTGIGLAICKRIVDQFDGKIWIESSAGNGCTVHFTIPKA